MKQYGKLRSAVWAVAAPLGLAVAVVSCESILNTQPMGELNDQTFYKSKADYENATLGAYSTLLNYYWEQSGNGLYKAAYMPSDEYQCNTSSPGWPGGCDEDQFRWNADNNNFREVWLQSYKGVLRSNMILQKLPESKLSEADKKRFEGEAKFLRGYFYFMLARHFAEPGRDAIPLITEVAKNLEQAYAAPAPTAQIWDLIESDLATAAANLPKQSQWRQQNQIGRATSGAANALLGKVRIYRAQWFNQPQKYQEAIQALEAVVNSGEYTLVPNFSHNFLESHKNNPESVFEIQQMEGSDINGWDPVDSGFGSASIRRDIVWGPSCYQGACQPGGGGRSYGLGHVTPKFQAQWEGVTVAGVGVEDPRRQWSIFLHGDPFAVDNPTPFNRAWSITGSTPSKYIRPIEINTYDNKPTRYHVNDYNNQRLIRFADVLLLLAEAKALSGQPGAADLVNQVRARARNMAGSPVGLLEDVPAGTGPQWHRQYLQRERRLELFFEGDRYGDLVRWHRAGLINIKNDVDFGYSIPNANWEPKHLIWPIPQQELERNKNLSQNTGY